MKVGDRVKIKRRGTKCGTSEVCKCFVGEVGVIQSVEFGYDKSGICVTNLGGKKQNCSGFDESDLELANEWRGKCK